MNIKVLVTGVTGFIGSLVAEEASRAGFEIIGVSRRPVGSVYKSVRSILSRIFLGTQAFFKMLA